MQAKSELRKNWTRDWDIIEYIAKNQTKPTYSARICD